jgi:tRNA (guanine-N7-)-methyltransferase
METFPNVFQFPFSQLQETGFEMKGKWNESCFGNNNPIVLELGCGKGEYTVSLGKMFPSKNFIGIDIKGARIWTGAKQAIADKMQNVAFLRTHIELIDRFFAQHEIAEIWITFPDPQAQKRNKRLTSSRFLSLYSKILRQQGIIHLKTDSNFLYTYTCGIVQENHLPIRMQTTDLYRTHPTDEVLAIRTFYEQQWLERGLSIKYLQFVCEPRAQYLEPDMEIEPDGYRSTCRRKNNIINNERLV